MSGRRPPSPSSSDPGLSDPSPKRIRHDADDGKERIRVAIQEQVLGLTKLLEDRRSDVHKAEAEVGKAEAKLEEARAQLEEAQRKLGETESQLNRAKSRLLLRSPAERASLSTRVKVEKDSEGESERVSGKPPLVVSSTNGYSIANSRTGPNIRIVGEERKLVASRPTSSSSGVNDESSDSHLRSAKGKSLKFEDITADKNTPKKRPNPKEHTDLVSHIRESSTPVQLRVAQSNIMSSQHKRKLRTLIVNPTIEQLCATSALDGIINLWQIQGKGLGLSLLSSIECLSPGQRRWPEDMAWDPTGDSIFACYTADGKDSQVAVINISSGKKRAEFLDDKPHVKGILNTIVFMPWYDGTYFATGGSDHAVIMWEEQEDYKWKCKSLHRNQHTSAVMGVAGLQKKQSVLSVGADKRVVGFDMRTQRAEFKYLLESKAMGVLPNPSDFNLFMVQTGTPERQLLLFDYRVQRSELHVFGWAQESSESQSALINQSWSPDGLYLASGSADPKIHLFDIRYNSKSPMQSIKAHQKRVFTAAWHESLPLLISISSDLNIGLHRIAV